MSFHLFRLIDPQTQVTRLRVRLPLFLCSEWLFDACLWRIFSSLLLQFPLATVLQCASHQDNRRLFGFILQSVGGRGDSRAVCYIFESNNDGEKVVCLCTRVPVRLFGVSSVWPVCLLRVLDLWQHRSGQADSLPLWDGKYVFYWLKHYIGFRCFLCCFFFVTLSLCSVV